MALSIQAAITCKYWWGFAKGTNVNIFKIKETKHLLKSFYSNYFLENIFFIILFWISFYNSNSHFKNIWNVLIRWYLNKTKWTQLDFGMNMKLSLCDPL